MVLADSSLWIAHFRAGHAALAELLSDGLVLMHPFVAGELACGNLRDRTAVLSTLAALPVAARASDVEVLRFVEDRRLRGRGLGWVDVHLLAAALLSHCRLWTLDKRLASTALEAGVGSAASV